MIKRLIDFITRRNKKGYKIGKSWKFINSNSKMCLTVTSFDPKSGIITFGTAPEKFKITVPPISGAGAILKSKPSWADKNTKKNKKRTGRNRK